MIYNSQQNVTLTQGKKEKGMEIQHKYFGINTFNGNKQK